MKPHSYHNYMEELVEETVDQVLTESKTGCACDQCRLDIIARTLNRLPPKYVVTMRGSAYTKLQTLEAQFSTDLFREVTLAADYVCKHPRHNPKP